MKKALKKVEQKAVYYFKDDIRIDGVHDDISGNVRDIYGNVSGISGDVSGISGNMSGISGNVRDISGDIDECDISPEEREKGINIEDLVQ